MNFSLHLGIFTFVFFQPLSELEKKFCGLIPDAGANVVKDECLWAAGCRDVGQRGVGGGGAFHESGDAFVASPQVASFLGLSDELPEVVYGVGFHGVVGRKLIVGLRLKFGLIFVGRAVGSEWL